MKQNVEEIVKDEKQNKRTKSVERSHLLHLPLHMVWMKKTELDYRISQKWHAEPIEHHEQLIFIPERIKMSSFDSDLLRLYDSKIHNQSMLENFERYEMHCPEEQYSLSIPLGDFEKLHYFLNL